jgi:hypothetical protein
MFAVLFYCFDPALRPLPLSMALLTESLVLLMVCRQLIHLWRRAIVQPGIKATTAVKSLPASGIISIFYLLGVRRNHLSRFILIDTESR